jgi:hypothetical protein
MTRELPADLPIKLELTLEEVNGVVIALGDLPTKTNAFMLVAKINGQVQPQLPPEEAKVEDVKPEDIKPA